MDCIPAEKTRIMNLTQDNTKKVRSPNITDTFTINTTGVYNHVINALTKGEYDEVYKILTQLKIIIRCVWRTLFTYAKYPDLKYLHSVSKCQQKHKPFYGNKVLTITPRTKELDSEVLAILQRNLIPPFDYDIENFSDNLWDKYLLVFDNILLSESIQYRKELKIIRDMKLKEIAENRDDTYEQQYAAIIAEYSHKIDTLKQDYIFKIVNYLNWLHYNGEHTELAWAVVLLRLSVVTKNKYHNEQYHHNENDFVNYIKNYKYENKFELLCLYVAIIVYRYQFVDHSIIAYDKEYIETVIHYLTDTLPTFDEYVNNLVINIFDNIVILRLILPVDVFMKLITEKCLTKFSYKVKPLYDELCKYFPVETLDEYNIKKRIDILVAASDICKLFNKMSGVNYKNVSKQLDEFDENIVLETFKTSYLSNYGPYTRYIVEYMITKFGKQRVNDEVSSCFNPNERYNRAVNSLYGLLIARLDNTEYYNLSVDKIMTLLEASNCQPSETIINFIRTEATNRLQNAKGYDKYQLETILENL